jgi:hypothetical protein
VSLLDRFRLEDRVAVVTGGGQNLLVAGGRTERTYQHQPLE